MPLLSDEDVFGAAAPGLLSDEDVFGTPKPKAAQSTKSTRAGIGDYLNAANTALATGVANIGASAGTILQDPGGAIVSGLTGARAAVDRGMTSFINAIDPGAAAPHAETQRAAQIAAETASDRRAANAAEPWNVPARVGKYMEEDSRRVAAELQAQEWAENPALVAQQEEVAKAQGFTGNLKAAVQNPLATFHTLARSAPDMALGVGMGATVARAGGGVGAVSAAGTASEAASSGMQAREGTYQQVVGMPLEQLAKSPRFQEIAQAVGDPVRAREILANELADQTPVLSGAGTAAGTLLTNRLFGGDATAKTIVGGERITGRELGRRVAQDTVEEGVQGVPEDTVQHGAVVQADPSKEWDPGGSLAQNLVSGFAMGAGGHGQRYVRDVASGMRAAKPDPAADVPPPAAPPAPVEAPAPAPAPAAQSVATANTTQAEEALLTPAPLTALDRVAEIDGRLAAIAQQAAKGTDDAQAQNLATESVALTQERDGITSTWPKAVPGAETSLSTEAGVRLDARYALMDADSLVTSHDENLRASPLYPPELQPRDRSRSASELQVSSIVQKLDPARLGVSADAATGAPIVGADGLVESGNGRTIALKRVYQANGQKAEDYKQFLRANAGQFGLTPEAVEGMAKPVLVRVRSTPVNRAEFARQANASTVQRMSPSEQALSDAKRLTSLEGLNPDEDGNFASNRDFIRQFMATLPITEQSDLIESDGRLSTAGYRRIQNAVLARAYGDSPSLRRMTESMDNNLLNVSKALVRAAPTIAAARERMDAGTLHQADIAPDLLAAVEGLSALKEKGWTPQQELAQGDLTGPKYSPEAAALLEFLDANIRSPRRIAEFLGRYYEALEQHGDPSQPSMFGDDALAPARADLLTKAKGTENGDTAQDPQRGIDREAAPDRQGDGRQSKDAPGGSGRAQGDEAAGAGARTGQPGPAEGEAAGAAQGVTVEDLAGDKINRTWTAFADDSGTLGIPRAEMPQIKAEHRGALVNFLKARGVEAVHEEVPAGDLKPTQAEFSPEKVAQAKEFTGGDRSILASSDGHVLDGHHQWLAKLEQGEPIKTIRLDAPIAELLPLVAEFPSAGQADGAAAARAGGGDADAVTRTAAFKRWFGDSKVVDADGKPMRVFHGTNSDVRAFDSDFIGEGNGGADWGPGFYFTDQPAAASNYAQGVGGNVMPVYLSIQNPASQQVVASVMEEPGAEMDVDFVQERLRAMGHDGIIVQHPTGKEFIVFEPTQIKSATGNNGQFDPTKADIRLSFAGSRAATADSRSLVAAQDRLDAGENAETVRRETGWHRGSDGRMRWEISDSDAQLRPGLFDSLTRHGGWPAFDARSASYALNEDGTFELHVVPKVAERPGQIAALSGVRADELHQFVPPSVAERIRRGEGGEDFIGADFRDAKVIDEPFRFDGFNAMPLEEVLEHQALFAAYPALRNLMVRVDRSMGVGGSLGVMRDGRRVLTVGAEDQLSTILHEVQHGIQDIEGFATGDSPDRLARTMPDEKAINDAKLLARFMARGESAFEARQTFRRYLKRDPSPEGAYMAERYEPDEIARMATGPMDAYKRSAGEVEARNTQARQGLSAEERRATPPGQTADVADRDVIVSFNGQAMARAPAPSSTGLPLADLAAIAERVRTSLPNMPTVHTLASPAEAPAALQDYIREQGAWNDVEGALHQGELYLFASGLRDPLHAEFVLAEHEAAHFGLRALLGPKLPLAMRTVFNGNPEIQRAVAELQRRGNLSDIEATEEVLVDMPSDQLAKLKGWRRVVSAIQNWLASNGFEAMAQRLQGWLDGTLSDQQRADLMAADLVRTARDYVAGKVDGNPREARGLTRLYDQIGKDLAVQEKWLAREAQARGYKSVDDLLERNYSLFERLGALWKLTHADAVPVFSRGPDAQLSRRADRPVTLPTAIIGAQLGLANEHADYPAAKGGDPEAAMRLARDLVTPEMAAKVRDGLGDARPVVVPVVSEEASGRNKIPGAVARVLAAQLGLDVAVDVVQANRPKRTAMDGMDRIFAAPEFNGDVQAGQTYLLVDDALTQGATFASLASHIEGQGGTVAGVFALTGKGYSATLAPSSEILAKLREKYGDIEQEFRAATGYGFDALTQSEARYLANFKPADTLRAEIVARGGAARRRDDGQDGQGNGDQTPRLSRGGNSTPPPGAGLLPNRWQQLKARVNALTSAGNVDKFLYEFQDKLIDLKRLREHIRALGGTINDLNDAYQGEELYHKRVAKRTEDFLASELKPLLADARARGVTVAQLEEFLHARHAPEANKELSFRNPNQQMIDAGKAAADAQIKQLELALQRAQAAGTAVRPIEKALEQAMRERDRWNGAQAFKGTEAERLSLSGMSDADAAAIMAALSPRRAADLQALANRVDGINAKTLDALQSYGLMDAQTLQAWRSTYQHYVPLHRDEAHPDSVSHPIGQGYSVKGDAGKRRAGSNAKVTHILGHIAMQREAALTRGEKNMVGQKLYLMAAQNPDPEWWQVDRPPKTRTVDSSTGLVVERVDPLYKNRPNVIMVRIAGADAAIVFNERNERAARLAESLRNLDAGDLHYVLGWASKATRWFASVNTQYNPVFGIINFARDVQGALLNLGTTPLKGKELQVARYMLPALRSIYQDLRAVRGGGTSGQAGGQWGKLWDEMQNAGGTTGYRDLYADPKDRAESLEKAMAELERGRTNRFLHSVVDWLSDYNETMEGATRLAAYKAALDMGISQPKAASLAKNLTVNFNRKGANARSIGAAYAFFNAAVQGTARMVETLRGPTGKKVMLGGVMLGAMNALIGLAMMGGDDGEENGWMKIPEFVRERSLVIPLGREDFVAIPLPLGFNVLPNLGRKSVEAMSGLSKKSAGAQLGEMLGTVLGAFNPFGAPSTVDASQLALMLSPTVIDPAISLAVNRDWTGKPIYRENTNSLDPEPGHRRTKETASTPSKFASLWLNKMSGGTDYRPGAVSWTPDQIDFVIGQLTGGVGRELMKVNQAVAAPFTGDELPAHKIPLLGRLYGNVRGPSAESGNFHENVRELNELENELKGRAQDGGDVEGLRKKEPLVGLIGRGAAAERQIQQLRKQRNVATKDGDAARVKEINEQIGAVMKDLNREVARARKNVSE